MFWNRNKKPLNSEEYERLVTRVVDVEKRMELLIVAINKNSEQLHSFRGKFYQRKQEEAKEPAEDSNTTEPMFL